MRGFFQTLQTQFLVFILYNHKERLLGRKLNHVRSTFYTGNIFRKLLCTTDSLLNKKKTWVIKLTAVAVSCFTLGNTKINNPSKYSKFLNY